MIISFNVCRFHQEVKQALERRRADVVELSQELTEAMSEIHGAIVQCMSTTLAELRRSRVDVRSRTIFHYSSYLPL